VNQQQFEREMINAVTESPRLSRFSRAGDSCRCCRLLLHRGTRRGAARSDGETSRVWHGCPSVSLPDSLIETKLNNYSWSHSQISGGSISPAWNMSVCSSVSVVAKFISVKRCVWWYVRLFILEWHNKNLLHVTFVV